MDNLTVFNTIFISILMQAFPFMLIGVIISSFIHIYVSDEVIVRLFPTKYGLGYIPALFVGLFLPVCECATVPVMNRLVKKGVPVSIAITFMLSAPIINPIAILSTLYAFPERPVIAIYRIGFGLFIALMVGLVIRAYGNSSSIFKSDELVSCHCHGHHELTEGLDKHEPHESCDKHDCHEHHTHTLSDRRLTEFISHIGEEFFGVGKYIIFGAFITSLIQISLPRDLFFTIEKNRFVSLLILMLMAFLFSACSTSDAFIARNFVNRFSMSSIMGFLVFGPMMDIKNLFMLLEHFKKGFVVRLLMIVSFLNLILLYILTQLFVV